MPKFTKKHTEWIVFKRRFAKMWPKSNNIASYAREWQSNGEDKQATQAI